jgi:hypothetical protein
LRRAAAATTVSSIDCNGEFAAHFGSGPAAYLIRPDGYVGFHCRDRDVAAILPRYVSRYFAQAG